MSRIEVTVTLGDRRITLEGPEDFVREEVRRLAKSELGTVGNEIPAEPASQQTTALAANLPNREADLLAQKRPRGHVETVAVLAYCLAKNGIPEFTPEDIHRAYVRGGVRPPKVVAQAIRDAKNTADFIERGSKAGTYKLTTHGEATVVFGFRRSARNPKKRGGQDEH